MLIKESRLRRIIRNVLKESIDSQKPITINKIKNHLEEFEGSIIDPIQLCGELVDDICNVSIEMSDLVNEKVYDLLSPYFEDVNTSSTVDLTGNNLDAFMSGLSTYFSLEYDDFDELAEEIYKICNAGIEAKHLKSGVDRSGEVYADEIKKALGAEVNTPDKIDDLINMAYEEIYLRSVKAGYPHEEAYKEATDYIKSFYEFED